MWHPNGTRYDNIVPNVYDINSPSHNSDNITKCKEIPSPSGPDQFYDDTDDPVQDEERANLYDI